MASIPTSERLALIRENLAEILNPEILEQIVEQGRNPKIYWGRKDRPTPAPMGGS